MPEPAETTTNGSAPSDDTPWRGLVYYLRFPLTQPRAFLRGLIFSFPPVLLTLGSLAWAADLYTAVGLALYNEQFIAGMMAVALPIVFLTYRPGKGRGGPVAWYDMIAAVVGFGVSVYVAIEYPRLANEMSYNPLDALIIGLVLLVLVAEALRRAVGYTLMIMLLLFLAYAMWGHYLPGKLTGRSIDTTSLVISLALDPHALLGIALKIGTTVLFAFVFMGRLLFISGGSAFFTELSQALMGSFRGGSAKIAVTASGLFGSISGSAVSNVVSTGVVTIPMMRKSGYAPRAAAAIEAVASTGGQLMPPVMGVTAFVMAEMLEVGYGTVVIAATVPAILYYAALFFMVDLEAARAGINRVSDEEARPIRRVLLSGWYFPLPFGVLIYGLFWLNLRPEEAALWGGLTLLACALVFGYRGKRLGFAEIVSALRQTGVACVEIMMITAAAGLVIGILNLSGLGFALTATLVKLAEGSLIALLLMAGTVCIVLGMGMPTLGVYVLLATLVAPAIVQVGVEPIAAHLFVLYFGLMSMITPPIAIAAFAAATLAGANPMRTGYTAVRFGWLAYLIPFLFIASPGLLLKGGMIEMGLAIAAAGAGVWLVSVAVVGYLVRNLGWPMRAGFLIAGLGLLTPSGLGGGLTIGVDGLLPNIAGLALGVLLVARELIGNRRTRSVAMGVAPGAPE
ncbi:MAG: TRAP transporter fused permease subunit [Alphaproteobacteria bacterium]|nr:TRAP transporter fused permease subunit [Alphaproteobacteria bacterium]